MRSSGLPRVLCLPTGPDEYAAAVVRALALDAEVEFVAPAPLLERYQEDLPAAVRVHPLRWPRHRDPRNLALLLDIIRVARNRTPDVIHFLGDGVVWLALALPVLRRRPVVVTVHDVTYHPGDTQTRTVPMATIQVLRRAADTIIVHGAGLRRELLATGIAPPAGVHVVAHPVLDRHVRLAQRLGLKRRAQEGRPLVLFFGRVMAYKGLGLLIDASDHVVNACPGVRIIVAGRGPDLARWRAALAARPWFEVRDRYIPDAEVAQLFLDADLVVMPYIEASQSGVAALAAGFGRPVIATAAGELGALIKATNMGQVVPTQAMALADAIGDLLLHPEKRAKHASCAVAAAEGELSPRRVAAATLSVYQYALIRRGHADRKPPSRHPLRVPRGM
jgi:glycosyltransferase involved in cell wall biosynthesis